MTSPGDRERGERERESPRRAWEAQDASGAQGNDFELTPFPPPTVDVYAVRSEVQQFKKPPEATPVSEPRIVVRISAQNKNQPWSKTLAYYQSTEKHDDSFRVYENEQYSIWEKDCTKCIDTF